MKLVVGLGNPGKEYENTRHNAGFIAINLLLKKYGYQTNKTEFKAETYYSTVNGEKVVFMKPQTFMNLSGEAIRPFMDYYKVKEEDIVIIYDEKDFPIGKDQMKQSGSAGGHNGIKSIIQQVGNQNFNRIRIGVGQPKPGYSLVDWVLSHFTSEELNLLESTFEKMINFVNDWTNGDNFNKIMSKYNPIVEAKK
ncbi:aminoacyl-tRNA hydrolase [Mesoplasma lactucae]|uniref:Peptidyl-tRNA hydrolase n=1 Tax=Mesoplasma lactucae ATCC 49193 TaxID=81460 RepID=A0A291ISH7_9MOLU|nr:aminoacyl-tRNA hydrolase [Mesoplasma lactucae]ATG97720.1 aminoacyl-tRNA hydrolase [Mesoplasma lactucae ATCC 49193]ATZ20505.1 peptidyl-tRNA hydrolase [Mesoplasma lactucae ATCC 49193]MCL8216676.1 Peptidyl-tRNA hydrolase [Mesoplasma lactucae ATCC 49193]